VGDKEFSSLYLNSAHTELENFVWILCTDWKLWDIYLL